MNRYGKKNKPFECQFRNSCVSFLSYFRCEDQNPGGKGQCMVAFLSDLLFRKYAEILKKY